MAATPHVGTIYSPFGYPHYELLFASHSLDPNYKRYLLDIQKDIVVDFLLYNQQQWNHLVAAQHLLA
jgi:hypothetical protein